MSLDTENKIKAARRAGIALAAASAIAAVPLGIATAQSTTPPATPAAGAAAPAAAAVTAGGLGPGEVLPADKKVPASITKAMKGKTKQVVIGFVLPGITEDEVVYQRLIALQKDPKFRDTTVMIFRITPNSKLKDLPEVLDMTSTPLVSVFQRDGKLSNTWRGLVDKDIIAQSVIDARNAVPKALQPATKPAKNVGDPKGLALVKKVNAHYAKAKGLTSNDARVQQQPINQLTRAETFEYGAVLEKGRTVASYVKTSDDQGSLEEVITGPKGTYRKAGNFTCWTKVGGADRFPQEVIGGGLRVGKPIPAKNKKGVLVLPVFSQKAGKGAKPTLYRIDAATFEIRAVFANGVGYPFYKEAPAAPQIPTPEPAC